MKKYTTIILLAVLSLSAKSQTNVSGGVYVNTTWTNANSPYIVTDTVVVFPGVILTIEPGVVVKFDDDIVLEIRQSTLIALGNSVDSITFTSNSGTPLAGIWKGIVFNNPAGLSIDYCVFKYAFRAVYLVPWVNPLVTVSNSSFYYNTNCVTQNFNLTTIAHCSFYTNGSCLFGGNQGIIIDSCYFNNNASAAFNNNMAIVTNCIFTFNQIGLSIQGTPEEVKNCSFCNNGVAVNGMGYSVDTLLNCTFMQNHIALTRGRYMAGNVFLGNDTAISNFSIDTTTYVFNNSIFNNHIGIIFIGSTSAHVPIHMYNNNVCHNTVYNLSYGSSNNVVIPGVCWCDTDSVSIATGIYDGYDNVSYGLVQFIPFVNCNDSVLPANNLSCPGITSGINSIEIPDNSFTIYPNPTTGKFTVLADECSQIIVINALGKIILSKVVKNPSSEEINLGSFAAGIYFVKVYIGEKQFIKKLIVQ